MNNNSGLGLLALILISFATAACSSEISSSSSSDRSDGDENVASTQASLEFAPPVDKTKIVVGGAMPTSENPMTATKIGTVDVEASKTIRHELDVNKSAFVIDSSEQSLSHQGASALKLDDEATKELGGPDVDPSNLHIGGH